MQALCLLVSLLFAVADPSAAPSPAASATPAPIAFAQMRIDTMLRTGHAEDAWFSAEARAQNIASKVRDIVAQLNAALGAYARVEYTPDGFVAHYAKGTDLILIHLNAAYEIDGIFFKPPVFLTSSLPQALDGLQQSDGTLSYVAIENGRETRALDPTAPLAVGSAFKLAILNALVDQIASGQRHWNDVVRLDGTRRSLPSGVLQTWPDGTPVTIATLATEMISISDNTAADSLLRLVGDRALQRYAGTNAPLLSTRELFVLHSSIGAELRTRYLASSSVAQRKAVLARVDRLALPGEAQLNAAPDLAVEYHFTVRDLCRLIDRVASLPLMSVNPGAANAADFERVAYKGGSDTGVITMTTHLRTKDGRSICVSATLNRTRAVDDRAFETAYARVLAYYKANGSAQSTP